MAQSTYPKVETIRVRQSLVKAKCLCFDSVRRDIVESSIEFQGSFRRKNKQHKIHFMLSVYNHPV